MAEDESLFFCDDCGDIFLSKGEKLEHTKSVHGSTEVMMRYRYR